ncbi:hypothetical protein [Demequina aurantiaca]|uniref:hypothetical protein n=1 Tax=Demequina aurantiaca TaxID=676200 RepID=UPI0007860F7F|nr:hypothetical protein [Demequina aurantiaca]
MTHALEQVGSSVHYRRFVVDAEHFSEAGPRWGRSVVSAIFVAVIALTGGMLSATSAAAHGGPYELEITSDAAGGIAVSATYVEDGHVVSEIMDPVAEATSADGRNAGPIELISSSEGVGRWVSEEPFLDDGDWTVTVTTTQPEETTATVEFTVAPLEAPVEPAPITSNDESAGEVATDSDSTTESAPVGDDSSSSFAWLIFAGAAGLIVIVGVAVILAKRRSRAHS